MKLIRFALFFLMALLVGTMFGILVGFNPTTLSATAYVEQQQIMIRSFNTLLPAMGGVCILLSGSLAYMTRSDSRSCYPLIAAACFLIVAALVTRFANQPINAVVITWSSQSPPEGWQGLRDEWWHWHIIRSSAGIAALCLTSYAVIYHKSKSA